MKRRTLLQWAGAAATLTGCSGGDAVPNPPPSTEPGQAGGGTPVPRRQNVLFIPVDDLNDWLGFLGGHPQVKTPGMDALAARSAVFRKAYCNAPVCGASRPSVLSGLSVQNTGVFDNDHNFKTVNPGKKQIDEMFADAGYTVRRFGKIDHMYESFEQPLPATIPYANKKCAAPRGPGAFDWGPAPGSDSEQPDYKYMQLGIDFLNAQPSDQPFFLSVGLVRTHLGWYVPQRFFDMYPKEGLSLPYAPADDLDDLGASGEAIALKYNFHKCIVDQGLWTDAVQAYLASISWVDSLIARLLAALDASPHALNTTIVLWSDHGFHLGEKFHWHKMALWERATRVPLLISLPGQQTRVDIDACVSLQDIAPTLLAQHKVEPAYPMDGKSLLPLMGDPSLTWDVPVLTTKDQYDYSIRTADWRYIRYASGERELYDERADPAEHFNLATQAGHESIMASLDALMPPQP